MSLEAHETGLGSLDALEGVDALVLLVAEDERPLVGAAGYADWRLCGELSRLLAEGHFTGAPGESLLMPLSGRFPLARLFVLGLGKRAGLDAGRLGQALAAAARVVARAGATSVALEVPGAGQLPEPQRLAALREHFLPHFKGGRVAALGEREFVRLLSAAT